MIGKENKICKDWESATLMLYRNICNIWHKNVIQISYRGMLFISCQSNTSRMQLYKY